MVAMPDGLTQADLDAYVDGQLGPAQRLEIEDLLARHAELAAQVMRDLAARNALRLVAQPLPPASAALVQAARQLERGLRQGSTRALMRRAAAIGLLVGTGWLAHVQLGPVVTPGVASDRPPAFVDEAVSSHETARLRAGMPSQTEVKRYEPDEIRASTAIPMPELPSGWQVVDLQVFPTANGPGVEALVQAGSLGTVSLFAARPGGFDVQAPVTTREGGLTAAYWQMGEVAYALTGQAPDAELTRAATGLQKTLY